MLVLDLMFKQKHALVLAVLMSTSALAETGLNDDVLLRDGDLIITKDDMVRYIQSTIPQPEQSRVLSNQDRMITLMQNIYVTRALAKRAKEFDVTVDSEQLKWEHEFNRDTQLTIAVQDAAVKLAQSKVDWDSLAKEEYLGEPDAYRSAEEVDAAHILITTEGRTNSEALALANTVRQKALSGENFNQLAKQFSEDKTAAQNGGELGIFRRGAMVKPFSDAVFAMEKSGSISEPVRSQFGYHIIKLNKKMPRQKQDFETVKPQIIRVLQARVAAQARDAILTDTRSKPGVIVNQELFEEIRKEFVGSRGQ